MAIRHLLTDGFPEWPYSPDSHQQYMGAPLAHILANIYYPPFNIDNQVSMK